ncbi:hypothetical protein EB001_14395 [bacterium]|nr:hypothetical protein [bacterium]
MQFIIILIFVLVAAILYLVVKRYKKENSNTVEIPKKIEKVMKKSEDNPKGIIMLASKIADTKPKNDEPNNKKQLVEAFEDIKDIRYGKIGASNHNGGDTINKWIKVASFTVTGAWDARGFTLEVYPRSRSAGSSRQTLVCLVRNAAVDIEAPYVSLTTHNESEPNTRLIKDVRVIRTSGSGITNNNIEIWIQFGQSWADTAYVMYYLYNFKTNDFIATVPQAQQNAIPGGQAWGINDRYEPNGTFTKDIGMVIDAADKGIHGISMSKTDEEGKAHTWKQWHMDNGYGRNDLQLWEYAGDASGATCGGSAADGALCQARFTVKGHTGRVGINTTNPQGTLEVAGDIRIGRWSLRDENGVLVFRDMVASAAGRDKRHALFPEQYVDNTEDRQNVQTGEEYLRLNCGSGPGTISTANVTFAKPYNTPPRIVCALGQVDWCNYGNNLRVNCWAANITTDGFIIYLQTWADTSMWSAVVRWTAFYSSAVSVNSTWDVVNGPNTASNTWDEMNQVCESKGKRLCSSKELCPSNQPITNMNIFAGKDNWMAVNDKQNQWLTYATFDNRLCKVHDQVVPFLPEWGNTKDAVGFYKVAKCCPK